MSSLTPSSTSNKDASKKVLMTATVYKFFERFETSDLEILKDMGYELHLASNMYEGAWLRNTGSLDRLGVVSHQVDFQRSPFKLKNIKAYMQLRRLLREERFELIHCHTEVASAITRVAAAKWRRHGAKVIFTCHGFHFNKRSSRMLWHLFYPMERFLARKTDLIITINHEDFDLAKGFNSARVEYIPGVGVDVGNASNREVNRDAEVSALDLPRDAFIILTTGELSDRKNQEVIIRALAKINAQEKGIYYLLCGAGANEQYYIQLAKDLGLEKHVRLLGYTDHEKVLDLCHAADLGAIPSRIEGLGLAGIEVMAAGTPLVGSDVQGIKDYLLDEVTGISCGPDDTDGFAKAIERFFKDERFRKDCGINARSKAKEFDLGIVRKRMRSFYKSVIESAE